MTHPPGREGLTKSVIIVSSEGGRGLTKVSPDIEREMGWGKKKKKFDDDEEGRITGTRIRKIRNKVHYKVGSFAVFITVHVCYNCQRY